MNKYHLIPLCIIASDSVAIFDIPVAYFSIEDCFVPRNDVQGNKRPCVIAVQFVG